MTGRDSDPDLVRTLRELGRAAVPVPEASRAEYQRERVTRAIRRALSRVETARSPSRRALVWLSAAGLLLAVGGAGALAAHRLFGSTAAVEAKATSAVAARSVYGTVTIESAGVPRHALVGDVFRGGEVVTTGLESRLSVAIESGSAALGASGELEFVPPTASERRVRLGAGTVEVDLPVKLDAGRHLVVETPDVDVVVVGTAFSVGVERSSGTVATEVSVRRGTVWIMQRGKQRAVLTAGQTWRTPLATAATTTVAPVDEPVARPARVAAETTRAQEGTLAEENRLFQVGLSARNAGDALAAADAFGLLLGRFPRSVLAEQALAERFRALERAGRTSGAVAAARRYLAAYPRGFARVDAERIAQGSLGER